MTRPRKLLLRLVTASAMLGVAACASTTVKKDPGQHDRGVRFYRPKPYLLLTPTQGASEDFVSIALQYLPDYSEEYSIHVRAGVGTNKTHIKLDNGWNLTGVDYDVDSKTNENIAAVAKLVEATGKIIPSSGGGQPAAPPPTQVKASNVPLGYYESVISRGPDGRKQLYGWRYLGFLPYTQCPVDMSGRGCADCQGEILYGLVFESGVMTFKPMPATAQANNVRDPKAGVPALPSVIAASIPALKEKAADVLPAKLGTAVRGMVEVVLGGDAGKTYVVTVTLPPAVYKKVLDDTMQATDALKLAAANRIIAAALQPEVLKLVNNDTTWDVAGNLQSQKN